jgi:hypothetical protein
VRVVAGGDSYRRTFPESAESGAKVWDGRNWFGPSDTFSPEGDPFPAGDYSLDVTIDGALVGADGGSTK